MRNQLSGWARMAAAFAVLIGLGAAMIAAEPPPRPEPEIRAAALPMDDTVTTSATTPAPAPIPSLAADSPFAIKRILPISGPIRYGDWHWDDAGIAAGPIVITVDLDARVLSVFRAG
jgi:hypothetical protein